MDKYKLLKDLPDKKAGCIDTEFYWLLWIKDHYHHQSLLSSPDWFEKIKKIPEWIICIEESAIGFGKLNMLYKLSYWSKHPKGWYANTPTGNLYIKHRRAKEATKAEVEAHKLGFHIGDPVTFGHTSPKYSVHFIGNITAFNYEAGFLHAETNKDKCVVLDDNIQIDNPKITTEEGNKLYGNDKCWVITKYTQGLDGTYGNWTGNNKIAKYFSKAKNAKQYFAKLQATKKGIKVDTDISNIPKERCDNCLYFHTPNNKCNYCYLAPHEGNYDNWEKKLKFEVGKWYKHDSKAIYAYFKQDKTNVGFYNGHWYHTAISMVETDKTWGLANIEDVKTLLLMEAKKRYPIGTKYKSLCNNELFGKVFSVGKSSLKGYTLTTIFSESFGFVYYKGKWAEIVESKLMLGNVEVEIRDNTLVHTIKGAVLISEWLRWANIYTEKQSFYFKNGITEYKAILTGANGVYLTTLHPGEEDNSIGCIKNVSWDQIRAVTKAIKTYGK